MMKWVFWIGTLLAFMGIQSLRAGDSHRHQKRVPVAESADVSGEGASTPSSQ